MVLILSSKFYVYIKSVLLLKGTPIPSDACEACYNASCGRVSKPETKSESSDFLIFWYRISTGA